MSAAPEGVFFCETVTAGPLQPWHLRPPGTKGRCLGGGAGTPSLCGREVAWDIGIVATTEAIGRHSTCPRCAAVHRGDSTPQSGPT